MSRSPLAYPLTRGVDADIGGSAELQTDVMRFMAILALCLVAIFALVQSLPLVPTPTPRAEAAATPAAAVTPPSEPQLTAPVPVAAAEQKTRSPKPASVALTRPQWVPKFAPQKTPIDAAHARATATAEQETTAAKPKRQPVETRPPAADREGFTLRFESDHALTRLVAAHQVGLYAITAGRARRMTVSDSRISFWDASVPSSFHEMEAATVPGAVVDALLRNGADAGSIRWGVTLPGMLHRQLDTLLQENAGGSLVIGADGNLRLDAS